MSVPRHAAETTIVDPVRSVSATISVVAASGCPLTAGVRDVTCGIRAGTTVALVDRGRVDVFRVIAVAGALLSLQHASGILSGPHESGARLVEVRIVTYYVNAATAQLMRYNGVASDAPVVDQVKLLAFSYFGESPPGAAEPDTEIAPAAIAAGARVKRVVMRVRVRAAAVALRRPLLATRFVPELESRIDVALRNQVGSP
jgi:hypothetical protein